MPITDTTFPVRDINRGLSWSIQVPELDALKLGQALLLQSATEGLAAGDQVFDI